MSLRMLASTAESHIFRSVFTIYSSFPFLSEVARRTLITPLLFFRVFVQEDSCTVFHAFNIPYTPVTNSLVQLLYFYNSSARHVDADVINARSPCCETGDDSGCLPPWPLCENPETGGVKYKIDTRDDEYRSRQMVPNGTW
jgi:hypothetical protein